MSLMAAPLQSGYPDEFSDAMANLTSSILQEQLAPILETLREHAKLLDQHAALLNHSTAMNRYNVGKLDDIRDFQNNLNFKLQFYVEPEDRLYPNYRSPQTPTPTARIEHVSNAEPRLLASDDAHIPSDEPTYSTDTSSPSLATTAPGLPDRPSTPAATEPADSRPTTPRQRLGDGFSVVPGPSRRLQRERPFSVAPDPMWNSSREINPFERLAAPAPPPPYVSPPTYAEIEPAEHIEMETETVLRSPTLTVRHVSLSSSALPPAVVEEEEEVATSLSSNAVATTSSITTTSAEGGNLTASEDDATQDDPDLGPSPQLSEKARGKKRMREEEEEEENELTSDEEDELVLEDLFGEGSGSGQNPNTSGRDDGEPDRKRTKTDIAISTDRLEGIDADVLMVARMGLAEEMTDLERRRQLEKLKAIQKLYRSGRDSF